MPCADVTEIIELHLDAQDRVSWYRLRKRTCGGSLGMPSLIKDWLIGRSISEVLEARPDEFLASQTIRTITGELIHLKHFFAVRKTLEALTGAAETGGEDSFLDTILYGPNGLELIATIPVEVISEEIASCEGCGSCGSKIKDPAAH